jgi:hypothetical protein
MDRRKADSLRMAGAIPARYPTILLVSNDLEQLGCAVAALCRDNAELGQVTADRVRQPSFADGPVAVGCDAASGLIVAARFWSAQNASTGRVTASQIAAASLASFLLRLR